MRGMDGDVGTARNSTVDYADSVNIVNVSGTSNVPLGYRLRSFVPYKPKKPKIVRNDPLDAIIDSLETDRRLSLLMQDERRHERKLISISVQKVVDDGMAAFEEDLEERRDKLRSLLLIEEANLTRELVQIAKKLEEERAAELAVKIVEAEQEREAIRQEFIHEKQLQRFVETNTELREARRRYRVMDTKRANAVQIAQSEKRRRMESEEEAFWHEIMMKKCNEEIAEDEKGATIRANRNLNLVKTLREQMEAKSRIFPSEEIIDKDIKILPFEDPLVEKEVLREKNRKLREDLGMQLAEAKRSLEKRRNEERALDEMTWTLGKADLSEVEKKRDREASYKENLNFMENLKGFRKAVAQREAEVDDCLRNLAKDINDKTSDALRLDLENKKKKNHELKLAWDQQLEEKRSRQEQDLNPAFDPDFLSANEAAKREELLKRRQAAREYGRELLSQHEEYELKRIREIHDLEEGYKLRMAEQEREERELAEEVAELGSRLRMSSIP